MFLFHFEEERSIEILGFLLIVFEKIASSFISLLQMK